MTGKAQENEMGFGRYQSIYVSISRRPRADPRDLYSFHLGMFAIRLTIDSYSAHHMPHLASRSEMWMLICNYIILIILLEVSFVSTLPRTPHIHSSPCENLPADPTHRSPCENLPQIRNGNRKTGLDLLLAGRIASKEGLVIFAQLYCICK